jgi:hypothetical protein
MTPEELANKLTSLINSTEAKYSEVITSIQNKLYNKLVAVLKDLELDAEGYIVQNSTNRAIIQWSEGVFEEIVKSNEYVRAVEDTVSSVPDIDKLNEQYFEEVSKAFKPNRVYIKSLHQQVIQNVNTFALNEGLILNVKIRY